MNCGCSGVKTAPASGILSADKAMLNTFGNDAKNVFDKAQKALKATAGSDGLEKVEHVHLTAGGVLCTVSESRNTEGIVVLRGSLNGIPYEMELFISMPEEGLVVVTLKVTKPIAVGPYEWRFKLGGLVKKTGVVVAATSVEAIEMDTLTASDLDWLCVLKCGGVAILPVLVLCLPSLAGGPMAYVACVTATLGAGTAAEIAVCVAMNCA